jgi:hypothetical protein
MSVLNSLFDIVRGGWTGNDVTAIDETAPQAVGIAANNPLVEGDIVILDALGTWDRATAVAYNATDTAAGVAIALANLKHFWLVVSGVEADQYDGLKQDYVGTDFTYVPYKVTAIRGEIMYETERFTTGRSYVPGDSLTVAAGLLDRPWDESSAVRRGLLLRLRQRSSHGDPDLSR